MHPNHRYAIGITFIALALLLPGLAMGQANQSLYTSLEEKQCKTVRSPQSEQGDYEGRCKGIAGYSLIVTEGDLRQNVTVLTPAGTKHSLDLWEVISGGFSTVGPRAEWRMSREKGKLKPIALIIRFNASEDAAKPDKTTSYLAVAKITSEAICVVEKVSPGANANAVARSVADASANKPCLKAND